MQKSIARKYWEISLKVVIIISQLGSQNTGNARQPKKRGEDYELCERTWNWIEAEKKILKIKLIALHKQLQEDLQDLI
jgi:hypothetical protein